MGPGDETTATRSSLHALRETFGFLRGNIAVLTATGALGMFCRAMVFPYASLYILALGGEPAQIGLINSLYPLAGLVVFPLSGYLTDRAGRVRLIVLAGYASAAVLLLNVFAPTWQVIALAGLLQGFLVLQFPPSSAIIADSLAPEERAVGMATMRTIAGTLALFSPYLAGVVIDTVGADPGMRYLYAAMAGASFASASIHLRFLKETASRRKQRLSLGELPAVFRRAYGGIPAMLRGLDRRLRALAILITLSFMANAVASPFWVVFAVDQIGLTSVEWGLILLAENGVRNLAFIPAGVLVDRYGRTKAMAASLVLSLVTVPLFAFATGFTQVLGIRLGVAVANAFFSPACAALMADLVPRESRGRVMAALGRGTVMLGPAAGGTGGPGVGFITTLPLMVASLAGGYLYTLNTAYPWAFVALTTLVSLGLLVAYVRDPENAHV